MKLQVRIREGVARGLCGSCEHARIMVNDIGQQQVLCEENHPWVEISRPIVACTDHQAKGRLNKYEMEKIAWTIEKKGSLFVGFSPPQKKDD